LDITNLTRKKYFQTRTAISFPSKLLSFLEIIYAENKRNITGTLNCKTKLRMKL